MKDSENTNQNTTDGPAHCGSKPKKIAIGIVPMGIVTIGIVPMGVVSLGVVAMGVINDSIVGMGVFSAGITTMGLKVWTPIGPNIEQSTKQNNSSDSMNIYAYPTKTKAIEEAKKLGCKGIHRMGDLWMPCATHGLGQ